jgi:hypothetical protein
LDHKNEQSETVNEQLFESRHTQEPFADPPFSENAQFDNESEAAFAVAQ